MLASVLQALGLLTIAIGAGLAWLPAGLMVGGAGLVVYALAMERG